MKFYIASPFFNDRQIEIVEEIKRILDNRGFSYFSPKDDCIFENDKGMDSREIFDTNCREIDNADGIIAVTDGADAGTMWECGYAYGKRNVIYVWVDYIEGKDFNLMLAHSANAVAKGMTELRTILDFVLKNGRTPNKEYIGNMK